jgi:hypothetical protein
VPDAVPFTALKLRRLSVRVVRVDFQVLRQAWLERGYTADELREADAKRLCGFIGRWYLEHVGAGGSGSSEQDDLVDDMIDDRSTPPLILPM